MKDIKQYFANGAKVDESASVGPDNAAKPGDKNAVAVTRDGRKRKRVKIRISRTDSKERICDIIESKNDLIDKTPSPFAKTRDTKNVLQDGMPKSNLISSNTEHKTGKNLRNTLEESNMDKNGLKEETMISDDSSSNNMKNTNNGSELNMEIYNDIGSQREESNVFRVLMNRAKPIQYKSSPQQITDISESKEKSNNIKELRSKRKEKLTALADKKGYTKRKVTDKEEGEKIERNIENRMRFFKCDDKEQALTKEKDDNPELLIKNNKQPSGNLLDYFSKSPLELANKDVKCISTFTVKADVHRTETSSEPILKPILNENSKKKYSKSDVDLSKVDDIQIVASENLILSETAKQDLRQREKPRWSLRIKLHSSEKNDSWKDDTDDEIFSPKSRYKFNTEVNRSRKPINVHMEVDKVCLKNHNEYIKTKAKNREKNELLDENKDSNIQITVENITVNNDNEHLRMSDNISKMEEIFNSANETIVTITDDSECEIVNENILKRRPNEKLAPLFAKRRKTDPATMTARRLFLQSDITDEKPVKNKNIDKINNGASILPFPAISHVRQLEDESNPSKLKIKFPMKVEEKYLPSIDINKYKCITNHNEMSRPIEIANKPVKDKLDRVLSEIAEHCPDAQEMWKTISTIKSRSEKKLPSRLRNRKVKSLERKETLMDSLKSEENQSHDCVWTCKYKPMSAQEIVGNEEAAKKLKDWLSSWRPSLTKEDNSSSDEFQPSDCSTSYNNENNQIAVLLGPHGSGKSASVYAIAEELGYSVLELNASSRRTGKKISKELEEATKSHRIKKNKQKSFEQVVRKEETAISQNSLILLEDIDLIFEEDEGFVSAAYNLASNTKRPIVITCRDTCPHLSKMAPQQNKIYFQKVSGSRVSALLELISLMETGYRLPHNCLMKFLQIGDLRKALLQLQYLLLSGPPLLSEQSTIVKPSLWQDTQHFLYKPAIRMNRQDKTKKGINIKKSVKNADNISCILNNLANDLDDLAIVSSLNNTEDTALIMSEASTQPNLSLAEDLSLYCASHYLSSDIALFISDEILYKNLNEKENVQDQNLFLRKQLNQGVDLALSHVTSTCLDSRIMAIDYLPTARTICRIEESRSSVNNKRGNRFFHYLHGLQVPIAFMKPNILAAACRTLQEKVQKNVSMSNTTAND